jgi:hypothetical protein
MRLARLLRTALHARACAIPGARSVLMLHRYNKTVDLQERCSPCTRLFVRWMKGFRMTTPSDAMPCCPSPWPPWRRGCGACRTRWAARRCATKAKSPITCAHRGASVPDIPWLRGDLRALATAHLVAREHAGSARVAGAPVTNHDPKLSGLACRRWGMRWRCCCAWALARSPRRLQGRCSRRWPSCSRWRMRQAPPCAQSYGCAA